MRPIRVLVAGLAAMALTAGAAVAQDNSTSKENTSAASKDTTSAASAAGDTTSKDSSASMNMSKTDAATAKSCQAMPHDAMMKDAKCKAFMAKHSDMFNADGTMKSGTP